MFVLYAYKVNIYVISIFKYDNSVSTWISIMEYQDISFFSFSFFYIYKTLVKILREC